MELLTTAFPPVKLSCAGADTYRQRLDLTKLEVVPVEYNDGGVLKVCGKSMFILGEDGTLLHNERN